MRTVLFHRKYRRFHGGHLKVWHYFNHVLAAPALDARVVFDVDSSWDSSNPWQHARERVVESAEGITPDALFIAGRDWQRFDKLGLLDLDVPKLNLIQHMRHADEWSIQSRYLDRKAIRICVSDEVAAAMTDAGANGPVVVIPNGVDVPAEVDQDQADRPDDLFIAGLKQPAMAARAAEALAAPGRSIALLTDHAPRDDFLEAMRRARVTLYLPNEDEGFYLPALEGMALGTLVVCPDCIGNRSFCLPDVTALRPGFQFDELVSAAEMALAQAPEQRQEMLANAREMARRHSLASEREAFHRVLAELDVLWAST